MAEEAVPHSTAMASPTSMDLFFLMVTPVFFLPVNYFDVNIRRKHAFLRENVFGGAGKGGG